MIRVLQCVGSLGFGGSQTFIMSIYRAIDRTKVQFDFVVFPENIVGFYDEVAKLGGNVFVCPRFSARNCVKFIQWWHRFFREHSEYSIIHGHVRSVASIYLWIAKQYGLRTIIHSHSTSNGSGIGAMIKCAFQKPLRYIADYLFSCSDYSGKWLFGEKAMISERYKMIPNCVSCSRFAYSVISRSNFRLRYGIDDNALVIGHIGRFREVKNHRFLVDVFSEVFSRRPDAWLLLVGDGELREQTRQYCKEKGVGDRVLFVGNQANTEDYYSMMDVFILPSLWEGLPVCAVEAQASGLPCILSDSITRDVQITNLVKYVSLEEGTQPWLEIVLQQANNPRGGASPDHQELLRKFDSSEVANNLERFYVSISSCERDCDE